jgi:hypothetical protein
VKDKWLQIVEYLGGDKLWVKHLAEFEIMLLLLVFLNATRRFCACDVCLFWSESHEWAMACVAEAGHGWLSRTKITRPVSRCDIRKICSKPLECHRVIFVSGMLFEADD